MWGQSCYSYLSPGIFLRQTRCGGGIQDSVPEPKNLGDICTKTGFEQLKRRSDSIPMISSTLCNYLKGLDYWLVQIYFVVFRVYYIRKYQTGGNLLIFTLLYRSRYGTCGQSFSWGLVSKESNISHIWSIWSSNRWSVSVYR